MTADYNTVLGEHSAAFVERRSEFIGHIAHAETEDGARAFLSAVSKTHAAASHNVYCYVLRENNTVRFSDAGEPSGTAGKPALEVLLREGITDVCLVITRYFGGILLGAGGLTRAYAKSAKLALDAAGPVRMETHVVLSFLAEYADWARLEPALGNLGVSAEALEYGASVGGSIVCRPALEKQVEALLADISAGRAVFTKTGTVLRPGKITRKEESENE